MITLVTLEGYALARIIPVFQEKVPFHHCSVDGMPESSDEEIHDVGRHLYLGYTVVLFCE